MGIPSAQRAACRAAFAVLSVVLASHVPVAAQSPGEVLSQTKISQATGLAGPLKDKDKFGTAVAAIGDIDGDLIGDLAVGVPHASNAGTDDGDHGAIIILFLNSDGTVKGETYISRNAGGLSGTLANGDQFGTSITAIGDLDGDGRSELAVGAPRDNDDEPNSGAVWILSLNADGTVKSEQKISNTAGGFTGVLVKDDEFGRSVAGIGDLDGDGVVDIAVGAEGDDDGGGKTGAVWILFLNADMTVKNHAKISASSGGLTGPLDPGSKFGNSLAALGDLDNDGVADLGVGAPYDDDGGSHTGAVWILFLNTDGSVKADQKISALAGGFTGVLSSGSRFGDGLGGMGDLDGDGNAELGVGAVHDDDGEKDAGALWVLFLDDAGVVTAHAKISATSGGFTGALDGHDHFGESIAVLGDLDGLEEGGIRRVAVGASRDDDGGSDRGAVWMLQMSDKSPTNPFGVLTNALQGRTGRPALVLVPKASDGGDIPGFEPQVPSPDSGGDSVYVSEVSVLEAGVGEFFLTGQYGSGQRPAMVQQGDLIDDLVFGDTDAGGSSIPDLVVANNGGDSFTLLIGLADGSYDESLPEFSLLPDNSQPVVIAVGDVNGDLLDDVIVGGEGGISVFISDGLGGFPATVFTPLSLITDLKLGFVNGDNILDIVTTSGNQVAMPGDPETGFATLLLGVGDGSFSSSTIATDKAMASVLLGDLNGDTNVDLLLTVHEFGEAGVSVPTGRIELYVGDGLGGFLPSADFAGYVDVDPSGTHPTYGALGDLNGDGRLDAVYTSSDNISHPVGDFAAQQPPLTLTVLLSDASNLEHGDFDVIEQGTAYVGKGVEPLLADFVPETGDGILDAIIVWYEDGSAGLGSGGTVTGFQTFMALLVGDGLGNLIDPDPNQFLSGDEPGNPDLGNIDGGGIEGSEPSTLDLLVPNVKDNSLTVLFGDGDAAFLAGPVTLDVDNITADNPPNMIGIWQGGPIEVRLTDLDGDENIDAVSYNQWDDLSGLFDPVASLSLFLGDGTGAFVRTDYIVVRAGEFEVADMDGDLNNDIVVTGWRGGSDGGEVTIYPGNGDGTVSSPGIVTMVSPGRRLSGGILIADVDGNGQPDVLTSALPLGTETDAGDLLVYTNALGVLTENVFPLNGSWNSIRSIDMGDVSGDGTDDIVLGARDGQLFIATGAPDVADGLAGFTPVQTNQAAAIGGGGALRLGEFNGDGTLDIVSAQGVADDESGQASVRRLLGLGSSLFSVDPFGGLASVGSQGSLRPLVADLDGDGATDVVLAHGTAGTISVIKNVLASWEQFGDGKAGVSGVTPKLDGIGYTLRKADIEIVVTDGLGGAKGLLLVGVGKLNHPVLAIESVSFKLPISLGGASGEPGVGSYSLMTQIPDLPSLVGLEFVLQAVVLEVNSLAFTNGLAFTILQ